MTEVEEKQLLSRCLTQGLQSMFIATGRGMEYEDTWITYDENGLIVSVSEDLKIDELRYAYLRAKIEFFKQVQTDVNNIVGYTTDALTVTNADKPYQNLAQTIELLEKELRQIFYTMVRYAYM